MTSRWPAAAARRVAYALTIIFVATVVVFVLLRLAPGDPTTMLLGVNFASASPEKIAALRAFYGLDQPFVIQFGLYLRSLLSLDLGHSVQSGQAVVQIILDKAPYTLLLALTAGVFTYAVSIPLGVLAAVRKDSWIDRLAMGISALGLGVPTFALAIVLVWLMGLQFRLLPIFRVHRAASPHPAHHRAVGGGDRCHHPAGPVLDAGPDRPGLRAHAASCRHQRAAHHLDARTQERPAPSGRLLGRAASCVRADTPSSSRSIFRWPGLGSTLVSSILGRDYAVAQFLAILLTIVVIVFSQLADLVAKRLDPRLREPAAI